jgi:hypothetical protein
MKNTLLLSGALLLMATSLMSCKKDYTCECTKTHTNGTTTVSSKESVTVFKDNKKRALERCNDKESSGTDLLGSYSIDCQIK